jgi:hypothetical protein
MQIQPLRILKQAAKYLLISLAVLYVADLSVFEIRQARGAGLGSISVEQYLKTQLKGNKAEYDYLGAEDEKCSMAIFPQYAASAWNPPCWWLKRHTQRWQ